MGMSSACADARSAERSSGVPQGAARAARDARRRPRVGPCRARVLGARRTDVCVTTKAELRAIAKRSGDYAAYRIRGVARTAGGTTSPAPSSSAPPAQREPRGPPGLNRSSGRTTIAGSSRRILVALTLPAAWLADNGRAGLRSTMTCGVAGGPDAGWIQVSFRRCPSGVRLRYVFGVPLACGGPALLLTGSVAAACPEGEVVRGLVLASGKGSRLRTPRGGSSHSSRWPVSPCWSVPCGT